MGQRLHAWRLDDWHREAAGMLDGTRSAYDLRTRLTDQEQREDAVTVWRHTARLLSEYANGESGSTWEAFWADAMSRDAYLRLLTDRSRFNRCGSDGDASLSRDSVLGWEFDLTRAITAGHRHAKAARAAGRAEPIRRLTLEFGVAVSVAAAYAGCSRDAILGALDAADGSDPVIVSRHGVREYAPHALRELITANRPSV